MDPQQAGVLPVASADEFDALRADWATRPIEPLFVTRAGRPAVQAPGGPIHILLRGEETGGTVGFYEQFSDVGAAVGAHHQTTEDETFYILAGRWEFRAGDEVREVGPGTLIHAPSGTTHAFKAVAGPDGAPAGRARLLSWNAPAGHERFYVGMGHAKSLGLNPRLDAAPRYHTVFGTEPMADHARAVFATRADAPRTAADGVDSALLLDPRDTAGRSAAQEIVAEAGAEIAAIGDPAAHRYLFVVAGDWTITVADEARSCGADTLVQLPAGTRAGARLTGEAPGRLLVVSLPSGGAALS